MGDYIGAAANVSNASGVYQTKQSLVNDKSIMFSLVQLAGAVEYTNCFSAEE